MFDNPNFIVGLGLRFDGCGLWPLIFLRLLDFLNIFLFFLFLYIRLLYLLLSVLLVSWLSLIRLFWVNKILGRFCSNFFDVYLMRFKHFIFKKSFINSFIIRSGTHKIGIIYIWAFSWVNSNVVTSSLILGKCFTNLLSVFRTNSFFHRLSKCCVILGIFHCKFFNSLNEQNVVVSTLSVLSWWHACLRS